MDERELDDPRQTPIERSIYLTLLLISYNEPRPVKNIRQMIMSDSSSRLFMESKNHPYQSEAILVRGCLERSICGVARILCGEVLFTNKRHFFVAMS